jgi:uncharacterized protein YciI
MIVIDLTYKVPIEKIEEHIVVHRQFLQQYYDAGIFIASGPKNPRTGGVIIALGTLASIKEILSQDPFCLHDLADYQFTDFTPLKYCVALKPLLDQ